MEQICKKWRSILCTGIMFLLLTVIPTGLVSAEESAEQPVHELIFVLDISSSMNDNDSAFLAPDSLKQIAESLPSDWQTGLITYNGLVVESTELTDQVQSFYNKLDQVKYTGYTNTGTAISQAVAMFSENAKSRQIILLSDGEIAMPEDSQTQEAIARMNTAVESAGSSGIPIHTIGLGNAFQTYDDSVKQCSERTGGRLIEVPNASGLSTAVDQLVTETLGIRRISIGAAKMSGNSGTYHAKLPITDASQAKILILSGSPVSDVSVSCEGSEIAGITPGKRFASVRIKQPASDEISVTYTTTGSSTAWLIVDCDTPALQVDVTYDDKRIPGNSPISEDDPPEVGYIYERSAKLSIALLNQAGDNLLLNPEFSDRVYPIQIGEEAFELDVTDGYLIHSIPVAQNETVTVSTMLDQFPFNMPEYDLQTEIQLEGPPPVPVLAPVEEQEPEGVSLWVLIGTLVFLVLAIIFIILIFRRREKKKDEKSHVPLFDSKFEFTGKLNIYVTKTNDDDDIPPLTFDLFRLNKKKEISVKDMMDKCEIAMGFPGTDNITFVAGRNGALQIVNDSDCTILIGRDILNKKRSHQMEYGENIHITALDDTEVELHYRSVKPSEKSTAADTSIRYFD